MQDNREVKSVMQALNEGLFYFLILRIFVM